MTLLFLGNDTTIEITLDDVDGVPAVGATLEANLYRGADLVTGQDWPLSLGETEDGVYSGVLLASLALVDGEALRLVYAATHEGSTARWEHRLQAATRRATLDT